MFFEQRLHHPELLIIVMGVLLVVLVSLFLVAGEGSTRTLYVDDDAGEGGDGSLERPFQKIQDAINASEDGDTVRVWEGIYFENVVVNKTLTIEGKNRETTVVKGGRIRPGFNVTVDWVNLSGFAVVNGSSGIRLASNSNHIFQNNCSGNRKDGITVDHFSNGNIIEENLCFDNVKSGISLDNTLKCQTLGNNCSGNGDNGIRWTFSSVGRIENNTAFDNGKNNSLVVEHGAGIYINIGSSDVVANNSCSSNKYGILVFGG